MYQYLLVAALTLPRSIGGITGMYGLACEVQYMVMWVRIMEDRGALAYAKDSRLDPGRIFHL